MITESWTEQTLDVTSASMPNINYGRNSRMESQNVQDLETSRMSTGFADVSQLADEEKEKLDALIDRLEEERRRMIATTELLASSQGSEQVNGSRPANEKKQLRQELDNIKHYNSDLERELEDLRSTMHPSPPPRTSTPFVPYTPYQTHPLATDHEVYHPPHSTHPKELYSAPGGGYQPELKKPLGGGREPDIHRIIEKYHPDKRGVQVLPSRPSAQQFGGSPSSQRSSPYSSPSPHSSPYSKRSYDTRYPQARRDPHFERLKNHDAPTQSGYHGSRVDPHQAYAPRHRGHGSLGDIHDSPDGYVERAPDRLYRSLGNSPRTPRSRTLVGRRDRSRSPDRAPGRGHRGRSPDSHDSIERRTRTSPKNLHASFEDASSPQSSASQKPRRGRSPQYRRSPKSNTPERSRNHGDTPHRKTSPHGSTSRKQREPRPDHAWEQSSTHDTASHTSQSSLTSVSEGERGDRKYRAAPRHSSGSDRPQKKSRRPESPRVARKKKSKRPEKTESLESFEMHEAQTSYSSMAAPEKRSHRSAHTSPSPAPRSRVDKKSQKHSRGSDSPHTHKRKTDSRHSPHETTDVGRSGSRGHSKDIPSRKSLNHDKSRPHAHPTMTSHDHLSGSDGSSKSGSSRGARGRGSDRSGEEGTSQASLVSARHVVSCENVAENRQMSSHGSLDSVDTLHGGASHQGSRVYGTSNTDTVSPIPDATRSFDPHREYTEDIDPYAQIHSSDHDLTEKSCTNIDEAHSPVNKKHDPFLAPEDVRVHMQTGSPANPPLKSSTKSMDSAKSGPKPHKRSSKPGKSSNEVSSEAQSSDARSRRAKQEKKKADTDTDSSRSEPEGGLKSTFVEAFDTEESFETPEEEMKFLVNKLQTMMPTLLPEDGSREQSEAIKPKKPLHEVLLAAEETRKAIRRFAEYAIAVAASEI